MMKKRFLDFSVNFVQGYKNYSNEEVEKLKYGLEGLYLTLTKTIVIVGISIFLGIWKEVLFTLLFFNIIRYTGFGFHAEKSTQCLLLSILYFIIIPMIFLNIIISKFVSVGICLFCILNFILFAPADTKKRPLPNKKKRIIRKWATVSIGIIYSCFVVLFPNSFFSPMLLSTLVIQAIIIQPLLYKLFKQPYNNYKNYVKVLNT